MTIRDIAVAFGFEVDKASVKKAESSIKGIKNTAKKFLGALGIGFSLVKLNALYEEWADVNKQLKTAATNLGSLEEQEDYISKKASECRTSYTQMAEAAATLVKNGNGMFATTEQAADFLSLATKAFKVSGASVSEIGNLTNILTNTFTTGKMNASGFSTMLSTCPEIVDSLADSLGMTKQQVKALGLAGQITAKQLRNALVGSADGINAAFENTLPTISEALTIIKNGFAEWWVQFNDTFQITQRIAKLMITVFTRVKTVLDKVTLTAKQLADKIGGVNKLLTLIAITGGGLLMAIKGPAILSFLKSVVGLLSAGSIKMLAIAAVIILIGLLIEDFVNFMQGNDSVFEMFFESMGIEADEARKMCKEFLENIKTFITDFVKEVGSVLADLVKTILPVLVDLLKALFPILKSIIENILPVIMDLIKQLAPLIKEIISKLLPPIVEILQKLIPLIVKIVEKLLPPICKIIQALIPLIVKIIDALMPLIETVLEVVVELLDVICDILDPLIDLIAEVLSLIAPIIELLTPIVSIIIDLVKLALQPLLEIIKVVMQVIGAVLTPVIQTLTAVLKPVFEVLKVIFSILQPFLDILSTLLNTILKPITDVIKKISEVFSSLFGPAIESITSLLQPLFDILKPIMDLFSSLFGWVSDGLGSITSKVSDFASNIASTVSNAIGNAAQTVGSWISGAAEKVGNWASNAWDSVKSGASKAWSTVKGWFGLANGGYIGANNPTPVVIGDNKREGEIVSPISKMRNTVLDALKMFVGSANVGTAQPATISQMSGDTVNRNVSQTVNINNTFNGPKDVQRVASSAMDKSASDVTSALANALNYGR